nr:hypothetical protein PJ912_16705 [Pectobacterium colocasium]
MNILTNERLNKIASWCETYGTNTNVMIPAKEAEELVQRLLRAETKLADLYAQKPFMHGIGAPDGNAYFDECCVGNVGLMDAQVTNLNGDLETRATHDIQLLHSIATPFLMIVTSVLPS